MSEEKQEVNEKVEETDGGIKIDKASYDALTKSYKSGYLDGMIAGLYSSDVCTPEDIAGYLGAEPDYVKHEIYYFVRSCEDSEKMKDHISDYISDKNNENLEEKEEEIN